MAQIHVVGHNKIYRDLMVKIDGKWHSMEDRLPETLTDAQKATCEKLASGDWSIVVDDNGIVTLVLR